MRIAFFSDNFYPELSGITDTIITTGGELMKRGHELCYVAPHYSEDDRALAGRGVEEEKAHAVVGKVPVLRLPSFSVPSPTGQSRFALPTGQSVPFLASFKPDVIHTQSPYGVGIEALRAAKRLRVPLVGTNHTAIEDFFPFPSLMRAYDAWYYNHCSFVTAPYAKLIERMREKGFQKPGRALPNPANLAEFTPASTEGKAESRESFGFSKPVILYVGRLGFEKRVDVIICAAAILVKTFPTLTFVATGHGAAKRSLEALAKELGVEKHVRFTGFLSHVALPHAYHAANVFAFMSTSDSQSLALMQAYASGIPAVCARARGLPDYTPEDCGFLVPPGDYRALAEKLSLLLSNDALRAKMGTAAVTYAQKFAPALIAKEWEGVYQSVLTSHK